MQDKNVNEQHLEKKANIKNSIFISLAFYTVVSFIYVGLLAANSLSNKGTDIAAFAGLLLKDLFAMLAFSLVLGFSTLIFKAKKLSGAAKWTSNIVLLYASMLVAFLVIAGGGKDPSAKIMFVFISTLLFAVVYSVTVLILHLLKRRRQINK